MRPGIALIALVCLTSRASAQGAAARLPDGRPGAGYWQQRVSYSVDATLHPERRLLEGRARVTYHNNSPDSLRELHWHLYQNLFRAGATGRGSIVGRSVATTRGIAVRTVAAGVDTLRAETSGTRMRTALSRPLAPGRAVALDVSWDLEIPPTPSIRTGSRGREIGITLWYPQIAVYDDVHGWDTTAHTGQAEFYLEYGDWDVRLTLPAGMLAAATGELVNPDAVLSPEERARLGDARFGRVVAVVSPEEARTRAMRQGAGARTWHWRARQVRDFAIAASPDFAWDATRTQPMPMHPRGVAIHSMYDRRQRDTYARSALRARQAIEHFARRIGPYVYPQATVVSGPVEGMEFPMVGFLGVGGLDGALFNMPDEVLAHELAHQWFPMMVGSHETRHPFMDEGFATWLTAEVMDAWRPGASVWNPRLPSGIRGMLGRGDAWRFAQGMYLASTGTGGDVPLLSHGNALDDLQLGTAYFKPAAMLRALRDVLGDSAFDGAMREYYRRWLLRHPYPDDFIATIEDVAGRDLDWFLQPWLEGTATVDLGIEEVRDDEGTGGGRASATLVRKGGMIVPATVRVTLRDGTTFEERVRETVWGQRREHRVRLPVPVARLRSIEIDPRRALPDANRGDNVWPRGTRPAAGPFFGVSPRWLLAMLVVGWLAARAARAIGYLVAARAAGGRIVRLAAGRRVLWSAPDAAMSHDRIGGLAPGTLFIPAPLDERDPGSPARLRRGAALVAAGGALGSAAMVVALGLPLSVLDWLWRAGHRESSALRLDATLLVLIAVSTLALTASLVPWPSRGLVPGRSWLRLLMKRTWGERTAASRALAGAWYVGIPAAAWNPTLVRLALDAGGRPHARLDAAAALLAHQHARALGDEAAAREHLARAAAIAEGPWRIWRQTLRALVRVARAEAEPNESRPADPAPGPVPATAPVPEAAPPQDPPR